MTYWTTSIDFARTAHMFPAFGPTNFQRTAQNPRTSHASMPGAA
jgi:hypothetical protein